MLNIIKTRINNFFTKNTNKSINIDTIIFLNLVFLLTIFKLQLFGVETVEYKNTFQYWFDHLDKNGIFALKDTYYNKSPSFITLIYFSTLLKLPAILSLKLISIFFDFVLAYSISSIYYQIRKNDFLSKIVFIVVFGLPGVIINSSLWGNLDVIWVSLSSLSLLFLIKRNYLSSSLALALAFCFDLKALFIFPLYLVLFFKRKIPKLAFLYYSFIPPLVYLISLIPSFLMGRPLLSDKFNGANVEGLLNIYFHQNQFSNQIVAGATPNLYSWIASDLKGLLFIPIIILVIIVISVLVYLLSQKSTNNYSYYDLLDDVLLLYTTFVFIAPNMTQQSYFFPEILAILMLFLKPKNWLYYLIIIISSTFGQWKSVIDTIQIPFFLEFYWCAVFILISLIFALKEKLKTLDIKSYDIF